MIAAKTLTSSARRHDSGGQDATHTEKYPELHLPLRLGLINIVIQLPEVEGVLRLFLRLLMRLGRVTQALLANALLQDYQRQLRTRLPTQLLVVAIVASVGSMEVHALFRLHR